ncbi:MAG: hypothetical protein GX682_01945 [Clostridiaceae bacterium]|nr:hypothetical protein [Clostridiaceae bacterium]
MYYGKKKGIIIAIVVAILVIALVLGGIFIFVSTDLFKSNETLFYKYLGKTVDSLQLTENTQMASISKLQKQMPYTLDGTLTFNMESESDGQNNETFNGTKLEIAAKVDEANEKSYAKTQLYSKENSIFTLEYANSNNIYALKSDEIVTAFLGIENDNLRVLAQKLQLDYDKTYAIPNKITVPNYEEMLNISPEEKQHIIDTYSTVIKENISKESFTKENDIAISKDGVTYKTTGYRLNLTEEQLKQLKIKILETLKEDSITLNFITTKAKLLGLDKSYTEVNEFTKIIEEKINSVNNVNIISDGGLSVTIYVEKGNVVTTEVIFRNSVKYTLYGKSEDTITSQYLLIEDLDSTADFDKLEIRINESKTYTESILDATVNIDNKQSMTVYLTNNGTAEDKLLSTTCEVTVTDEDGKTYEINYSQKMNFVDQLENMIDLSRNNCGVLNDYATEQLQYLIQSISERIVSLIAEKTQAMGLNLNQENQVQSNNVNDITNSNPNVSL